MSRSLFQPGRALVAAALGLAGCGLAQAQSSVTLYGIVSQDMVHATNTGKARYKIEDGRLNASRIGFHGNEDLGGGLSAIFDIESGISPDTGQANGGSNFWNRGSYVGFKGSFGSVTLGRQWNVNDDLLGNFFIFGGYAVFSLGGFGDTSNLFNNSIKYVSSSYNGFTLEVLGALGEGGPRTKEIAGAYDGGPFKGVLSYHETENKATGLKDKLTSLGASYGMSALNLRFGYANANYALTGVGTPGFSKAAAYDLGADLMLGVTGLSVDYVNRDLKDSSADSHFLRLLAKYNFSKRTQVNANVVVLKNKGSAVESFYGIDGPGKSQSVFALGLSHVF